MEGLEVLLPLFQGKDYLDLKMVWGVLSALRGPDDQWKEWEELNEISKVKDATTGVLRWHFFKKVGVDPYEMGRALGVACAPDTSLRVERRIAIQYSETHFVQHATRGFYALGLWWNELNKEPEPVQQDV